MCMCVPSCELAVIKHILGFHVLDRFRKGNHTSWMSIVFLHINLENKFGLFASSLFPNHECDLFEFTLVGNRWYPRHPCGRAGWSSKFLAPTWPSVRYQEHWGNEQLYGYWISRSLSLPISHSLSIYISSCPSYDNGFSFQISIHQQISHFESLICNI